MDKLRNKYLRAWHTERAERTGKGRIFLSVKSESGRAFKHKEKLFYGLRARAVKQLNTKDTKKSFF